MTKKELRQKLLKYYQKNIDKKINNRIMPYKFIDLYALGLKENNFFAFELEYSNHVMGTIKKDIYNACGADPYCRDVFVDC